MKRKLIWLILLLLFSLETAMAQMEMQVTLTRASAAPFPTSAMAYYNNPMNYFNLTITPIDGRAHDVFISMTISSDATTTRIWTDERYAGTTPKINIPSMGKRIGSVEFVQHFNRRLNTNLSESYRGVSDLTLPEGTYHLCIDVHDYYDTASVIGHSCMDFDICYSGLAPEFTSPHLSASTTGGYDKLEPTKKTNFAWTGVVSNCFEPNAFDYIIQFVQVYPGQNVQEAVESNPVLSALDCGRRTYFTYDYKTNPYLHLDSGGVYAAVVEAVPADPDRTVNLSNDGKSQYLVFVWCGPNTSGIGGSTSTGSGSGGGVGSTTGNGDGVSDTKMTMRDNQSAVLRTLRKPNIKQPRPFSTIDDVSLPLNVMATPVSGDSVSSSDYVISLYEYVGDTSVSMARPPLKQSTLNSVTAHDGIPIEMVSDWSSDLVKGTQYLVSIKSNVAFRYNNTYRVQRVDFIDRFPEINRYDSVVGMVGHTEMTSIVIFQWGEGVDDYNVLTPSQILTIGRKSCDSACVHVGKSDLNQIVWKDALFDGSRSDLIVYDVYVEDDEGNGGVVYEKTGVSATSLDASEMKSRLTPGHVYSMRVRARMYYDQVGSENGVDSRVVRFVMVVSSNESSYNLREDNEMPMFRLKDGMLFDDEEETSLMRGRTAMAPVCSPASRPSRPSGSVEPDSVAMSFSTGGSSHGTSNKITVSRGFKSDRLVNSAKGNVSKNAKATVSAQLDMFTIEGELSQLPSGGWGGPAKVTVMDGVSATMNVALGTARDNNGQSYDWWYIYGGEQYSEPKTAGALNVYGFGGVFAHNMTINSTAYLSKTPEELVSGTYSGVSFTPQKNGWVARGGIGMALENKNLLNAYGILALAVENGHFSRVYVDMGAKSLADENPLMERDCQNIFTYEVTSECHVMHLVQLPLGVRREFKYSGVIADGKTENVGFGTLEPVVSTMGGAVARPAFCSPLPVSLDIETWRRDGQGRWCAKVGGRYGTAVELGDGVMLRNVSLNGGSRDVADPYRFNKELLSSLPNASKSEAMQAKVATVAESDMRDKAPTGALVMTGTMETAVSQQPDGKGASEALMNCLLGTGVDFAGWHGNVALSQSALPAEVTLDGDYKVVSVVPCTDMPVVSGEIPFSFFNDVEFSDVDARTGAVSPFSKCLFTTVYPVAYRGQGGSPSGKEIMIVDGDKGPRLFCIAMGDESSHTLRYSYSSQTGKIAADGMGGGFASGSRNKVSLCAGLYEKRYTSGVSGDRVVDVYTGTEGHLMGTNSMDWGLPLCGGTPQRSTIAKTFEVETYEAPYTLENQVLFTWPYNGDPFVPNEELDSACYIFFKQDRNDLFDGYSLNRKGKALRVFAVNQEMGNSKAAECRFDYFPSSRSGKGAVPYVKVFIPKTLLKTKNDANTYSPCHVSLLVIDTAEYAAAYKECSRKAAYSNEPLSTFTVCQQVGTRVYDLYFRLDHMYATYKALMETISDESVQTGVGIGYGADNVTVDPSNAVITSKLSTINLNRYFAFRNRSYLFDSYRPGDQTLYASEVVLPPIAVLAVNGRESIDDYYNSMIPEWLAVNESFYYQYAHLLYYQRRARWLTIDKYTVSYDPAVRITDLSLLAPASMRVSMSNGLFMSMNESELSDIFTSGNSVDRGNLSASQSVWSREGMQTRRPCDWKIPALIQVSSDLLNRVTAEHFKSTSHIKSVVFVKSNPAICIQDRVSPCVMKENCVFASFFSQLRSYAEWYAGLDEKERGEVRESLTVYDRQRSPLPQVKPLYLTMDGAPFELPKASLLTAYDSWSNEQSKYKNSDYWFDNWMRSNVASGYDGVKAAWTSPWLSANYCPANTMQYRQAGRRAEYRQYVVNPYYLSVAGGEESFLNAVFAICRDVSVDSDGQPRLLHNVSSDVRIAVHVPYNKVVKNYLAIK